VKNVVRNLPSGYNRDVQETKEPVMRAIDTILDMLAVATITAQGIEVDRARLESGFSPGIMATDEVFKLVQAGESFRDAYRLVAEKLSDVPPATGDFESVAKRRTSRGAPGNPGLDLQAERLAERENALGNEKTRVHEAVRKTAGGAFTLFKPLYS
jgi:argininosuccinate lyase